MGCGCQKVQVQAGKGMTLGPRGQSSPHAAGEALRSFVVDPDRVREVTGMTLPEHHQRALQLVHQHVGQAPDPLTAAQDGALLPSLGFGAFAGVILGRTFLFPTVGFPVAIALAALGAAAYGASKTLPFGCSCTGGGCASTSGGPSCQDMQACVDDCTRNGTLVGGAAGLGAGLLFELWSRRFPVRRYFF